MHSVASEIVRALGGRNGVCRCPAHDDKHPSLSVKDDEDGDIFVHCFAGCDYRDIKDALRHRGLLSEWQPSEFDPERQTRIATERRKRDAEMGKKHRQRLEWARSVWSESQDARNTLISTYLWSRSINVVPPTVRLHPALKHTESGLFFPAMVGVITQWPSKKMTGIHRTFLAPDGIGKADVDPNKKMVGRCAGGAVQLAPAGEVLAVTEGIETGLSVQQATGTPTWAALSTGGIEALIVPPPEVVPEIQIFADNDINGRGNVAAENAAERWTRTGHRVRIVLPPMGSDFNDMLQREARP
jgi:putative DNA primase/helicase